MQIQCLKDIFLLLLAESIQNFLALISNLKSRKKSEFHAQVLSKIGYTYIEKTLERLHLFWNY